MEMDYERFVRPTAGEIHAGTEEPERQPQVEEETSGGAESQPSLDAINKLAKKSCRELVEAMRTAFPREIRDIVYGKLVHFEDDPRRRVCVVFGRQTFRGTFLRYLPASALTGDDFSHEDPFEDLDSQFVKEDYVGPTVAREIAEAYYRSQTFIFEGIEFNHLHKFLHEDRFQTGVEPFRVIQHICLKIRAPILALRINYTYYYKLYTQIYLRLAGVFKGLDAIPGRATLLIDLIMGKHYDVVDETVPTRTTRLVDMMAFIEPSVRELKALGTRVEVAAQRPDPGALGRRSGDFLWFVFDTPSMPIEDFLTGAVKRFKAAKAQYQEDHLFPFDRGEDCYRRETIYGLQQPSAA